MCNLAGYIGPGKTARILCEMLEREAGLAGGYYTGIATMDGNRLYSLKAIGDIDLFEQTTDAMELPGSMGIVHSRSKSGGDWHWGHPFVSNDGKIAYIVNGAIGPFEPFCNPGAIAQSLKDQGVVFETETADDLPYPKLENGHSVHSSEIMCHLIRRNKTEGKSLAEAMKESFLQYPAEIVGLSITTDEPDCISFARFNMPLMIGRTKDEVFLASTAMAFPKDRDYLDITMVPPQSYGTVTLKETTIRRFRSPIPVTPITPQLWHDIKDRIDSLLQSMKDPAPLATILDAVKPIFPEGYVNERYNTTYEILRDKLSKGEIEIVKVKVPGADEARDLGITANEFRISRL